MPNIRAFLARLLHRDEPSPFPPEAHAPLHITDASGTTHYIPCPYCHTYVPDADYDAHQATCAEAFFARVNRALPKLPDTPRADAFAGYVSMLDMSGACGDDEADTREVDIWQDEDDGNGAPY